jgi:hypothetical protein
MTAKPRASGGLNTGEFTTRNCSRVNAVIASSMNGFGSRNLPVLNEILQLLAILFSTYLIALVLGYGWIRAIHYPFTLRQRKIWIYFVLFISAIPVLGLPTALVGRWLLPILDSFIVAFSLLAAWMVVAFYIVRRMSQPGGRLSQERQSH